MRAAKLILVGCVAACSAPSEPGDNLMLGAIAGFQVGDPQIDIETVGSTVIVRLTTYGNSCYSLGRTDVSVSGRTATVSPFDRVDVTGPCLDLLRVLTHEARIEFESSGPAAIVVQGIDRSLTSDENPSGSVISVTRDIAVP